MSLEVLVVVQLIEGDSRHINVARTESVQPALLPEDVGQHGDGGLVSLVEATMARLVDETRADALTQVAQIKGLLNS